jgi:hypothetical protein
MNIFTPLIVARSGMRATAAVLFYLIGQDAIGHVLIVMAGMTFIGNAEIQFAKLLLAPPVKRAPVCPECKGTGNLGVMYDGDNCCPSCMGVGRTA